VTAVAASPSASSRRRGPTLEIGVGEPLRQSDDTHRFRSAFSADYLAEIVQTIVTSVLKQGVDEGEVA
jgi:hypothetical protein